MTCFRPFTSTRAALAVLLVSSLPCAPTSARAGSFELIQPDSLDIARELGMNIAKYQAKFKEPVYATLALTLLTAGEKQSKTYLKTTKVATKEHVFSLTLKDHDSMAKALGATPNPANTGTLELSVFHPFAPFSVRQKLLFGEMKPGQVLAGHVEKQSMEEVELDKPQLLLVKSGPFDATNPPPKDLAANFDKATAYYAFEVTFSKNPPKAAEPAAGK